MRKSLFCLLAAAAFNWASVGARTPDGRIAEWERRQDSLRSTILERLDNHVLKNSFLEEFHIRRCAWVRDDTVHIEIPFNLHSAYDCGAPDCYSTDVVLSFPLTGDSVVFPSSVRFREHEHGCVPAETRVAGIFHLTEQDGGTVIYHCAEPCRTLVLFRYYGRLGTMAYYFVGVGPEVVTCENVDDIVGPYEEDGKDYPYKSTALTTNEYEWFL